MNYKITKGNTAKTARQKIGQIGQYGQYGQNGQGKITPDKDPMLNRKWADNEVEMEWKRKGNGRTMEGISDGKVQGKKYKKR